ncbi:MAG TPA: hypothetical protein VF062_12635 [Candidatus Limnocylindrales bacterium]
MGIDRRSVLRAGGLAGAVGVVLGLEGAEPETAPAGGLPKVRLRQTPTFTKAIHRRADQLSLRLEFYNLTLDRTGPAQLVKVDPATEAFIVVDFGPQHLAEHAFDEVTNEPLEIPAPTMLAGSSRLAFKVPVTPLPYTFGTVMAWKDLLPSLAPHAIGPAAVRAPSPVETALEVPWKVVLSPDADGEWAHAMVPVPGPGGRSVLWNARLKGTKARVIWTPDVENTTDPAPPGRTSLRPDERCGLVRLTARWDQMSGSQVYVPQPIDVDQLALSSSGAWLKSKGTWETRPDGVDLKEWLHVATMGRDHFVKVVDAGRAWPIRHRLELITITERKFEDAPNGEPVAALRQRFLLVPRDRELVYENCDIPPSLLPNELRDLPLKKIRILTKVTPSLAPFDAPSGAEQGTQIPVGTGYYGRDAFWPRVGALGNWADFMWDLEAEDCEGRVVRFAMPLIYVSDTFGRSGAIQTLKTYYESAPVAARRTVDLGGQKVALAKFGGDTSGETAYPLKTFTFGCHAYILEQPVPGGHFIWGFTPFMLEAGARLDAVDRIRGGAATTPQTITLHPTWITDGDLPTNPARVFAALANPVSLSYGTNASGGVAAPDMTISALSAATGPIDAPNAGSSVPNKFDPADFFAGADPKVLGAVSLIEILEIVGFGAEVPRLLTTEIEGGVLTSLEWETTSLKSIDGLFLKEMNGNQAKLMLSAKAHTYLDGRPPSTSVEGEITNFTVVAVGPVAVINLLFDKFGFKTKDGQKPDITVGINDVLFVGALEFVNVLREFMSSGGGGGNSLSAAGGVPENGGYVNISPKGIQAGYNLTLPPVACGTLLLENISFGARADLFFDGGAMRLRFNFAERNNPFTLTVMCFGGGGSVALTLGLDLFELFELSLEFGAKLALDIGVASGSISAMAGIYLAIGDNDGDSVDDGVRLTGYLRLNGELNILGLITLALEFYLAFTYEENPKHVWGEAQLTVSIEVLFFSASVTLGPIKKTFEGGDDSSSQAQLAIATASTPKTFADMTSPAHWAEYTAMFDPAAF